MADAAVAITGRQLLNEVYTRLQDRNDDIPRRRILRAVAWALDTIDEFERREQMREYLAKPMPPIDPPRINGED